MRTSLIILLALGLSTAAHAQTALLAASTETSGQTNLATPPDPGARPEARTLISQVVEAELQVPAMQKQHAKLVYIDVQGEAATARVDYTRSVPTKSFYYHLRQKDGQWVIIGRDGYSQIK